MPAKDLIGPKSGCLFPASIEDSHDSIDNDLEVHHDTHVLNIDDVVFEAFYHGIYRRGISVFYHAQRGNAGLDLKDMLIIRCLLYDLVGEKFPLCTRPH